MGRKRGEDSFEKAMYSLAGGRVVARMRKEFLIQVPLTWFGRGEMEKGGLLGGEGRRSQFRPGGKGCGFGGNFFPEHKRPEGVSNDQKKRGPTTP